MYVCLCNGLTESDVREASRHAAGASVGHVYRTLHARVDCGSCVSHARALIAHELRQHADNAGH